VRTKHADGLPPVPEKEILRQCAELLALIGAFVWRANSGAVSFGEGDARRYVRFNGAPGCSDLVGLLPGGRFIAVETKREGKGPTKKQAAFLAKVRAAGGLAVIADSLDELRAALAAAGFRC
jgi:hypothetical protein